MLPQKEVINVRASEYDFCIVIPFPVVKIIKPQKQMHVLGSECG
jgi:hypothetical protein